MGLAEKHIGTCRAKNKLNICRALQQGSLINREKRFKPAGRHLPHILGWLPGSRGKPPDGD